MPCFAVTILAFWRRPTILRRCVTTGCALTNQPTDRRRCSSCGSPTGAFPRPYQ